MARRDVIHGPVRAALINDGWRIVADPYRIVYKDTTLEADIKADKLLVATRDTRSIIIEVKSFLQQSFIHEFLAACGQYQAYRFLLEEKGQTESIYMAISDEVYRREFHSEAVQVLVKRFGIRLLVVDIKKKVVAQWIE
ncbi:MAG: element excision factor XisH family protein [Caldilineaceae bacterium]